MIITALILSFLSQYDTRQASTKVEDASEAFSIDGFRGFCMGLRSWQSSGSAVCTVNFDAFHVSFTAQQVQVFYHGPCKTRLRPEPLIYIDTPMRIDQEISSAVRRGFAQSKSSCVRGTKVPAAQFATMDKIGSILVAAVRR